MPEYPSLNDPYAWVAVQKNRIGYLGPDSIFFFCSLLAPELHRHGAVWLARRRRCSGGGTGREWRRSRSRGGEVLELVRGSDIFSVVQRLGSREQVLYHVQQTSDIMFEPFLR
jgi:hypothetical protein